MRTASPTQEATPSAPADEDSVSGDEARSNVARAAEPEVSGSAAGEFAAANQAFAFDLYRRLAADDGNVLFSPYSISTALAMTYAGARGETEAEMAATMHYTLPQSQLHAAFNALDLALSGHDSISVANSIWGQRDYKFLGSFLDTLALNYGAGLRLVDFQSDPEAARVAINDWVAEKTKDKIKDLIAQGMVDELTRLILVNAIHFKGEWKTEFAKDATHDAAFHLLAGGEVQTPMMSLETGLRYAEIDGARVVELPYTDGETSMLVIVPDEGEFAQFESQLNPATLASALSQLGSRQVKLSMPKFKFEEKYELNGTLAAMGMPTAFTDAADFSGMTGSRDLYIDFVVHKAFIAVDEEGTEAAAATGVGMRVVSAPADPPVELVVDRPFIFAIRDSKTNAILFLGRVLSPED